MVIPIFRSLRPDEPCKSVKNTVSNWVQMRMVQNNPRQNVKSMICAVIVTHNPDEKLSKLLESLQSQVVATIVVDNGTRNPSNNLQKHPTAQPSLTLIENHVNLGVATALNQGLHEAIKQGFDWMITFDQDSQPGSDFVEQLCSAIASYERPEHIAIVAPKIIDAHLQKEALFLRKKFTFVYERIPCHDAIVNDVTYVITSGAMINTKIAQEIGGFRDEFFIDYVDTEFCLRALQHGFRILIACQAELHHHFGDRKFVRLGPVPFFPSFHSPERWYTMSRNRIPMLLTYGLRFPHWLSYEIIAAFYTLLRMVLTENHRSAKLKALLQGTWDGLRGRMGTPVWATDLEDKDNINVL